MLLISTYGLIQLLIVVVFILTIVYHQVFAKKKTTVTGPVQLKNILEEQVPFYQQLNDKRQNEFEERAARFLTLVKITGVKTIGQGWCTGID
jgi:Mlc titration factor MtfA (ptsG expression regulator)